MLISCATPTWAVYRLQRGGLAEWPLGRFPGREDLVTLNRSATVSRLVSGVFHELNNSLQVIGGLAELLQDTPGIPPSVADGLRRIHGQNAKAGVAIAEVMAFARQKTDERGRVNMRDLTTRAVRPALLCHRSRPADDRLSSRRRAESSTSQGFANLLLQVVLNLIVNAEQALAGQQGGTIRVELESARRVGSWCGCRTTDRASIRRSPIGCSSRS